MKKRFEDKKDKIQGFISAMKYKLNNKYHWYKRFFESKFSISFGVIVQTIGFCLKTIILLVSFLGIVISSKMIICSKHSGIYVNEYFDTDYISKSSMLGLQITLTLICVSLIALVANIDKRYIYGKKIIDLAFPNKGLLSFKSVMITLFGLLLTNVCLMLKNCVMVYSVLVFLLTIYLSIIILYKFATILLNQRSLKTALFRKYYSQNKKQLSKPLPLQHYVSIPLDDLKAITIEHFSRDNLPELNENMRLYFKILKFTLFNNPKLAQEYYTEKTICNDVAGHIIDISSYMLQNGSAIYGLKTYNALLDNLNYYKICGNTNIIMVSISDDFIDAFKDITNRTQLEEYLRNLLIMCAALNKQYYLQTVSDLGYCRLAKHDMLYFYAYGNAYEKIYDMITKSTILSEYEKEEYLEKIRFHIIDLYITTDLDTDIDCFWNKTSYCKEKREYKLDIKNEPVACLYLRMIENNDVNSLAMYNSLGGQDTTAYFAKILAILSVLTMIYRGNVRKYMHDIIIDETEAKQLFKKCKMLSIKATEDEIIEYYHFVKEHYIDKTTESGTYHFNPRLRFNDNVVETFFAFMMNNIKNDGDNIKETASKYGYRYDANVEKIIVDFS